MNVSAIVVTRGDVNTLPILRSLTQFFEDIVVWDNGGANEDMGVYGRYCGIDLTQKRYVYVQDDDCVCPVGQILSAYDGNGLMVNVPEDEEHPWLGWGSIFPREMPSQFFKFYLEEYPFDDLFRRWSDVIFSELAFPRRVDFGHRDLPWADADDRMYRQPGHYEEQQEVRERCQSLLASAWSSLP